MKGFHRVKDNDWRTRAIIKTNGIFPDKSYSFANAGFKFLPYQKQKNGLHIIECIVRHADYENIYDAYQYSKTKIFEFTDQISVLLNNKVDIIEFLSTCPMKVLKGMPFEMLLPLDSSENIVNNPIKISESDFDYFEGISSNAYYVEATRQCREGLCSNSSDSKILFYFSALERIAECDSNERLKQKCSKCGNIDERGVATSRYIQKEMEKYGVKQEQYIVIRKLRSKIAHGSGPRDILFVNEVLNVLPALESATLSIVSKKCGINLKSVNRLHPSDDCIIVVGKKISEGKGEIPRVFNVINLSHQLNLRLARSVGDGLDDRDETGLYGSECLVTCQKPIINNECWPY